MQAGQGLWVYHRGQPEYFLKPAQTYLFLHSFRKAALFKALSSERALFRNRLYRDYCPGLWRVGEKELDWLLWYMKANWKSATVSRQIGSQRHPRYFPGVVRQEALQQFVRAGRRCAGANGRKPHRLAAQDRIEFDHILPYARGGASTGGNIQILCSGCNKLKRDSAL